MNISVTLKPGVKDFKYGKSNQELVEIIYSTKYETEAFLLSSTMVKFCKNISFDNVLD